MKAIIAQDLLPALGTRLEEAAPGLEVVPIAPPGDVPPNAEGAEIFLYNYSLPAGVMGRLVAAVPALRWIHSMSAGVDQFLKPGFVESDVVFTNSVGAHAPAIAESVFGMLLFVVKRLGEHWDAQKEHRWGRARKDELRGKTLGVIGLGHVGAEVARLGQAFGMRVVATRRAAGLHPVSALRAPGQGPVTGHSLAAPPSARLEAVSRRAAEASETVDEVWGPGGLPRLLAESDFVVMCAALTAETRGMIGEAELRQMKPTAWFVNIARGALVQEDALLRALREQWITGACLDVFAQEPLPPDSLFWSLPNVFVTPHSSASTPQLMGRALDIFLENLRRYRAGRPLLNVVDKRRGY
jgi:phosphoglycerate dehydrogenase-like enzyme